jgi:nickel superoxide dismutase
MRRSIFATAAIAGVAVSLTLAALRPAVLAHCEVPCGIYDDHARVNQMLEDAKTVAKATDQINALHGQMGPEVDNQINRWIMNKEVHATRIQDTIAQYFLTQRIKPKAAGSEEWDDYVTRLAEHHAVMVAAMKTKQGVDMQNVATLVATIERIAKYYPES